MKDLQEIKDEVAIECGWKNWESCYSYNGFLNIMINEIAIRHAQEQNKQLQEWKESMMTIHNELDLQGIGNALGLPLGASIAPQVLPKIKELVEQNKELVDEINESIKDLLCMQSSIKEAMKIDNRREGMYELLQKQIDRKKQLIKSATQI